MKSVAQDIGQYIDDQGLGTLATDIFIGEIPDDPSDVVVLYDDGGLESSKGHGASGSNVAWENHSVRIESRNGNGAIAQSKAHAIHKKLDDADFTAADGTEYLTVRCMQPPRLMGQDTRNRKLYGFYVFVERRQP